MLIIAAALPVLARAESKEEDQKSNRVRPRPDPSAASVPAWDGPQMLLADGKGQVSILRGDTLQVYPLEAGGAPLSLVGERAVSAGESKTPAKFVRSAATGAKGDSWVLLDGTSVRWFDRDGEKELDAPEWMVDAVAMAGDDEDHDDGDDFEHGAIVVAGVPRCQLPGSGRRWHRPVGPAIA